MYRAVISAATASRAPSTSASAIDASRSDDSVLFSLRLKSGISQLVSRFNCTGRRLRSSCDLPSDAAFADPPMLAPGLKLTADEFASALAAVNLLRAWSIERFEVNAWFRIVLSCWSARGGDDALRFSVACWRIAGRGNELGNTGAVTCDDRSVTWQAAKPPAIAKSRAVILRGFINGHFQIAIYPLDSHATGTVTIPAIAGSQRFAVTPFLASDCSNSVGVSLRYGGASNEISVD